MLITAIAALLASSLVSAAAIAGRTPYNLGPYGIDPTQPFNLYAYYANDNTNGYQLNLDYLSKDPNAIGLRGYNPYSNETEPPPTTFKFGSHSGILRLESYFNGKPVSNINPASYEPIRFFPGHKHYGGLVLTGMYQPKTVPDLVDNQIYPLYSSEYGAIKLCTSSHFGFPVLSYFGAQSPLITKPCTSATLQAFPLGVRPPIVNGP